RRDDAEFIQRVLTERSFEKRRHIVGGRRRGNGESHPGGARLADQPAHAGTQWDPAELYPFQVGRRLGRMQPRYQRRQPDTLTRWESGAMKKSRQALLAAGHLQELAIELATPAEVELVCSKCVVERLAVRLLRIRECAVDVENQRLDEFAQLEMPRMMQIARPRHCRPGRQRPGPRVRAPALAGARTRQVP